MRPKAAAAAGGEGGTGGGGATAAARPWPLGRPRVTLAAHAGAAAAVLWGAVAATAGLWGAVAAVLWGAVASAVACVHSNEDRSG